MPSPEQIVAAVQILGATGLLVISVLALFRKVWVPFWIHQERLSEKDARIAERDARIVELEGERDEWKSMALDGLRAAADVARVAKGHTTFTPQEAEIARRIVREAGRERPSDEPGRQEGDDR